jgi:hypothetical protein
MIHKNKGTCLFRRRLGDRRVPVGDREKFRIGAIEHYSQFFGWYPTFE